MKKEEEKKKEFWNLAKPYMNTCEEDCKGVWRLCEWMHGSVFMHMYTWSGVPVCLSACVSEACVHMKWQRGLDNQDSQFSILNELCFVCCLKGFVLISGLYEFMIELHVCGSPIDKWRNSWCLYKLYHEKLMDFSFINCRFPVDSFVSCLHVKRLLTQKVYSNKHVMITNRFSTLKIGFCSSSFLALPPSAYWRFCNFCCFSCQFVVLLDICVL
jgi:hypothetical protein